MLQLQRFASPEPVRRYAPDTPEQLEHVVMQLLAKDPADRFPNMQVLARHLQAMVMALSRATALGVVPSDDFALAVDGPARDRSEVGVDEPIALAATRLESEPAQSRGVGRLEENANQSAPRNSQEAATLAADQVAAKQSSQLSPSTVLAGTPTAVQLAPNRPRRFTTLEEEEALRRTEHRLSWPVIVGQLALLLFVLATIGGIAWYLSRPPSADQLYSSIMAKVDAGDGASLTRVENELDDFLARYANDPRAAVIERFKERNELDKLDRKLQRVARGIGAADESLLPAEQLYLQAVGLAESSPDKSLAMLKSLVNLYGADIRADGPPPAAATANKANQGRDIATRTTHVVQLARRRIGTLQADLAQDRKRQLADLTERLAVAETLSKTDPARAAAMYRAIIDLHHGEPWADEVVAKARSRLAELNKKL
ncbi:MAG TPA: hypothetical protein VHE81_09040, partial [Lacipirellulaceae bacterium]|nr:hypothetical protein [Lacipirellulaceae bacterium]